MFKLLLNRAETASGQTRGGQTGNGGVNSEHYQSGNGEFN
jgi:hypothetical protein